MLRKVFIPRFRSLHGTMSDPSLREAVILVLGNVGYCLKIGEIKEYLKESNKDFTDNGLRSTVTKLKQEGLIEGSRCYKLTERGRKVYNDLIHKFGLLTAEQAELLEVVLTPTKVVNVYIDKQLMSRLEPKKLEKLKDIVKAYAMLHGAGEAKDLVVYEVGDSICIGKGGVGKNCISVEALEAWPLRYTITSP